MQYIKNALNRIYKKISFVDPYSARLKDNIVIKNNLYKAEKKIQELILSEKVESWYNELSSNGIIKIENEFDWVKTIYNEEYFKNIDNEYFLSDCIDDRAITTGRTFAKTVSLGDPKLFDWYFNKDLVTLIAKIFQQQPFYRNQPLLQTYEYKDNNSKDIASKWHIDSNLHQITFMLLLNDLTVDDTHMEYALKSTKEKNKTLNRDILDKQNIENKFEIINCIGNAGTLFIFCGGMGYHRAVYKQSTIRTIYHANFTPGHDIVPEYFEKKENIIGLENQPSFIKHAPCALFKENPHNHLFFKKNSY